MRSDALRFAKERYFNGYSDSCSVQENFNLITSFIQDSADKDIPSKTSRSVSSVAGITPAIRRKIRRKNATHAKAKKSGSAIIRAKFETLIVHSAVIVHSADYILLFVLCDQQKYSEKSENIIGLDSYILNSLNYLNLIWLYISHCMTSLPKLEITV